MNNTLKLTLFAALVLASSSILTACGVGEAKNSAKSFASRNFKNHTGVECMSRDSDGDGYASCTIFLPNDAIAIECATEKLTTGCGNTGCRIATGAGGVRR